MTPAEERLRELLADGRLDLPPPAGGATRQRFRSLRDLATTEDLSVARLAEAHLDAAAIVTEAVRSLPDGALAGVWASQYGGRHLHLAPAGAGWHLEGALEFCSGAPLLDIALVDPLLPDGHRQLVLVPLRAGGVTVDTSPWVTSALAATATGRVTFDVDLDAAVAVIGPPDFYARRVGFWHGAIGVAACWAGAAMAVHETARCHVHADQPHAVANLGQSAAECWSMGVLIDRAADDIDADPAAVGEVEALTVRHLVAASCDRVLAACRRATGPGPSAFDADHARRIADLRLYTEQQHYEVDLERIGSAPPGQTSGPASGQKPDHDG